MKIVKLIFLLLLIMPFLFVAGTITSSAEVLGPVSVGSYNLQTQDIAAFGDRLKSATEEIVMLELDIARHIIAYIKDARPLQHSQNLYRIKAKAAKGA
jgi:hypothetical protein